MYHHPPRSESLPGAEGSSRLARISPCSLRAGAVSSARSRRPSNGVCSSRVSALASVIHFRNSLAAPGRSAAASDRARSEEHTSELQSRLHLVCRLLLEKKKKQNRHRLHCVESI